MLKNPFKLAIVPAVVMALLLGTRTANAGIMLALSEGAATANGTPVGSTSYFNGTVGDFTVNVGFGSSNSPGGLDALTSIGTWSVTNNSGSTETLTVEVVATGFMSPSGTPLNLLDTVSGSLVSGTVSGTLQGFVDPTNSDTPGAGIQGQLLNYSASGNSQSFSANGAVYGLTIAPPYSMSIIETVTLSAGSSVTLTGGNAEVVVPVPTGLVLVLTGMPILSFGYWLRRRQVRFMAAA